MPNHIYNSLQIIANEEEVLKIRNYIQSKNLDGSIQIIDFNKIIYMPDLIRNTKVTDENNFKQIIFPINSCPEEQQQIIKKTNEINDRIALQLKYNDYMHGSTNWYDWACNNWGTKWNAYNCSSTESVYTISFCTAWASPIIVIEKLSEFFPLAIFILAFEDCLNCDQGIIKMQNGHVLEMYSSESC